MSSLRETAAKAATKVRSKVQWSSHPRYPWLYPPECENDIAPVVQQWLQNKANLEYVSSQTGKRFKDDPSKNVFRSFSVVWTETSGTLAKPFPGKYLVIIGLEYIDKNNGLPDFKEKKYLDHGDFVLVPGDDDMILSKQGGGIALFIILDLEENGS